MHLRTLLPCAAIASALTVTLAGQPSSATKAFTGVRLIDGTARVPLDNATIVVRDGRVVAAGANVTIPAGAERVALAGKTVIHGLINAHGHVGDTAGLAGGHYSAHNVMRALLLYAAFRVTTVFSLGAREATGLP